MLTVPSAHADPALARDAVSRRRFASEGGAYVLMLEGKGHGGPLANVPVAIKDLVDISGIRTRCGSRVRAEARPAARDAAVVTRLRDAGARLVGKTALVEFAFGATGVNDFEGTPRNPHDPSRIPGGSSSGSAVAVAEGSAAAAIGTDTGGSVRIPGALCGVVGVKPSYGAIAVDGVFPLAPSLDHVGVLAPDVASVRAVLGVLMHLPSGHAPRVAAVDRRGLDESTADVARAVEDALKRWGVELKDTRLPDLDAIAAATTTLLYYEAARVHRATYEARREAYGPYMRARLRRAFRFTDADCAAARENVATMRDEVEEVFAGADVIVGPTVGFVAPTLTEALAPDASTRLVRFTRLWNAVRFPAISVPVPSPGLPIGLQIAARTDADALAAAASFEQAVWRAT